MAMKFSSSLLCAVAVFSAVATNVQAQTTMYEFFFQGTRFQTNGAGLIKPYPVTEKTLLKEIAAAANVPNPSYMRMVYHVGGSELGDQVQIINSTNGVVLDNVFGLFFGQSFARVGLTNKLGSDVRRIDYVYTKQDSHSMGAAFVTRSFIKTNNVTRLSVKGDIEWVERGVSTRMYSGTFRTGKLLTFKRP